MKKIAVLVSQYYPYSSPNGKCLGNVIVQLEEKYDITVIAGKYADDSPECEAYRRHRICRIDTPVAAERRRLENAVRRNHGGKKFSAKAALFLHRGRRFLKTIFSKTSVNQQLVREYGRVLEKINPDIVVPACFPFEAILAALEYKKRTSGSVRIIPYLLDQFAASANLHRLDVNRRLKWKRHLALERLMMAESYRILYSACWQKHLGYWFPEYQNKCFLFDFPLICAPDEGRERMKFAEGSRHLIYTGMLDRKVRNPRYVLSVLEELAHRGIQLQTHFFTLGNATGMVAGAAERWPAHIVFHGQVPTETAAAAVAGGDFLLSVGNRDIVQIPSKIYEYICTGKPIIHFYTAPQDPVLEILSHYPGACCLSQKSEEFQENCNRLCAFLDAPHCPVPFAEIEKYFLQGKPAYSAELICNENPQEYGKNQADFEK